MPVHCSSMTWTKVYIAYEVYVKILIISLMILYGKHTYWVISFQYSVVLYIRNDEILHIFISWAMLRAWMGDSSRINPNLHPRKLPVTSFVDPGIIKLDSSFNFYCGPLLGNLKYQIWHERFVSCEEIRSCFSL